MQESTSREKVLKAIRDALVNTMEPRYHEEEYAAKIYAPAQSEYIEVVFAEAFARVKGSFVYNSSEAEFSENLKNLLQARGYSDVHCYENNLQAILNEHGIFCINAHDELVNCHIAVTSCEFLVARTGSIMVSSRQLCGRRGFVFPPLHIVVAWRNQLVYDLKDAFAALKKKYREEGIPSLISMITGPSRTADIEKTLVLGAHGPQELFVFFIDDEGH